MTSTSLDKVDLSNCDREPIHIPSGVQSFGCLIAVSPDWLITHASSNLPAFFDVTAEEVIGTPLAALVDAELIHDLRSKLQFLGHADAVERLFGKAARAGRPPFDIAIHRSEDAIVLEFEQTDPKDRTDYTSYVRPMLDRLRKADTIEAFCALAAWQMQVLTGFDRVMVYRFAPDDCGEVIAEAKWPDMEPFLGMHYPASDIPAQARALYRRNLLRIISDIRAKTAAVIPRLSPEGRPLDLSMSALRAVSPIHLEYLRNMGVAASMSISILTRGRLWGLFACHHREPRVLSYKLRSAIELFGQLFAFLLDQKKGDLERAEAERAQKLHDRLMAQFADEGSIAENFDLITEAIGESIPSDGVVSWIDGSFKSHGRTPTREEFLGLARFLNTAAAGRIFAHGRLGAIYPSASDFADRSVGLLALPMSRSPRDYLVLFRQEMARSVRWAGNPEKPVTTGPNGARLTPRKSFKAWRELVRGQSAPWTEGEIRAAEALRMTLLEVVLRLTDTANREREIAQNRQELLIAELNHRVRNILNLIRGLISQSGADVEKVSDFTGVMGGRIDALARAHDLITRENWNSASFRELIGTEIAAYLGQKADRVVMTGPDVLLEPQAFSTMALVMHEMITNSAKYGALSDRHGQISIDVVDEPDGALSLRWRESGGPPVKAPTRRGFGSTIIERSIPYELKGETKVQFEVTGLQATFRLPARHVASFKSVSARPDHKQEDEQVETSAKPIAGSVLVVEDNLIIAMDAEDIFSELGAAKVTIAASVAQALRLIADETFALAILDVNLGDETSESVAKTLIEKNIPVIFATGYGEHASITEAFPKAPVLQKPYGRKEARAVLAALPL